MTGELFDPTPYVVTVRDPDRYVTPGMGRDARRTRTYVRLSHAYPTLHRALYEEELRRTT